MEWGGERFGVYLASLFLLKQGLQIEIGINKVYRKELHYNKYFSYLHNWYSAVRLTAQVEIPFKRPYINQKGIRIG